MSDPAPLVLASASPRRRELLAAHGIACLVDPSRVPEEPQPGEAAPAFAARVAYEKAREVATRHPRAYVLGADTVVVVDGIVFGKPADAPDARRMLRALAGRTHDVLTAVALVAPSGAVDTFVVTSAVEFRQLSEDDITGYLATDEPFDKAGAYAVQGHGAAFVTAVRGSYSNVVGLPMDEVVALLARRLGGPPSTEARP
jgi:septum formation protein